MTRNVHYVFSTHWDREWYQTFQDFRARLVQLMDRVIAGWESGALKGPFQTDGQVIILEDYLEIRPERREQVEKLVREGKFVVGPWYVLPDEFLVSGESLVRNLRMGREVSRKFGAEPSSAGFLCDMFGHNSQMPQIFAGFGIRGGFLWRGTNIFDRRRFLWQGADGSELPSYRFGHTSYCTYAIHMRNCNAAGVQPDEKTLEKNLVSFLADEDSKTDAGPLLAFDGADHNEWDPFAYKVLEKRFGKTKDGFAVKHTHLDAYLDEMLQTAGEIPTTLKGELREPGLDATGVDSQVLIPGVASSRVKIRQANAYCQDVLTQWAEPFSAFASQAIQAEYPKGYLDVAWRWLIQNHPHDSICGCSLDQVHRDMDYRFSQTQQIGDRLAAHAIRSLAATVEGVPGDDEMRVSVFNPLPVDLDEVVDLNLDLPLKWPTFNGMSIQQEKFAFTIHDKDGNEIPYQRNRQLTRQLRNRIFGWFFPEGYQVNVAKVSLRLQIPALGYTTLTVRAGKQNIPTRYAMKPELAASERALENEFLRVEVAADGTLVMTDKVTGQVYERLLTFEDCADIGDGWNFGPAVSDAAFISAGCHTSVSLVEHGKYKATLRLRTCMDVPEAFDFGQMVRSADLKSLVIDSYVSLREGAKHVEVVSEVENNALDHRLRVLFPSGATAAETYLADTPFDVVERKIALREDNEIYREPEMSEKPQQSFSAVSDAKRGLAVISSALLEAGVLDQAERPLALTLFRATRQTVGTNGEPDGQLQGKLTFHYWVKPFAGAADRMEMLHLGQRLSGGVRAAQLFPKDVNMHKAAPALPAEGGFMRLSGPAILTSLQKTAAGLEARVFNPTEKSGKVEFDFSASPKGMEKLASAQLVNLESEPVGKAVSLRAGKVSFNLGAKKIITVCFTA